MLIMSQQQKIITLQNGLTLVLQPMSNPDNQVNITFLFNGVGSAIDGLKPGISHLAEHMVFRGTNFMSAKDIAQKLTYLSNNAYLAYTDYDKTVFALNTYKNSLNDSVSLLVDMFSKSTLNDFETEKSVIKHELNSYIDTPFKQLYSLMDLSYGLKNNNLLQKEHLSALTQSDVQTFIRENYVPNKCTLIISGNIEDPDIVKMVIESKTKDWHNSNAPHKEWTPLEYKPGYFAEVHNNKCSHFSLFFKGPKNVDTTDIISTILVKEISGKSLNSIMMHDGRIDQGLAYFIEDFYTIYPDYGVYGVITWTDKDSFLSLLKSTMQSFKKLRLMITDPKNHFIDIAKIALKNSFNRQSLEVDKMTSDYMLCNKFGLNKDELIKIIDQTTTTDILKWFDSAMEAGPSLAAYGKTPDGFSYETLKEMWHDIYIDDSVGFLN